ncbi:hypothetical protein [Pseudogemmobacter faecipullorum]|uniref:Flp pilus-assembly TadG-like N-terminal domain-containing protein n=1 Tax=Pseudogemmobacter faecipullorum TaxID=2755041 RepID=A0ABS8CH50_9RHOB|nr:hypothetical protein [Pseudogemmobacter faecipullorum]MCB5408723.1 hypothetical protein [Pseudogemmobacter faecipullorum]
MRLLQRFLSDSSGALSMLLMILFPVLLLIGGLATDISLLNAQKRYVQSQADLATISATNHLPNAAAVRTAAREVVLRNTRYGSITLQDSDIRIGRYDRDSGKFIAAGNQASPEFASAVQVTVPSRFRPILLSPVLSDENITIRRQSVGVQRAVISFSLRNRLLSINTNRSILGRVLGPLGLGLNAEVLGYMGLATTKISLNNLLGLIANTNVGLDLLNFDQLLNLQVSRLDLLNHLVRLGGLANIDIIPSAVDRGYMTLGEIVGASPTLLGLRAGDILPDIKVNVFDLLMAMAGLSAKPNERVTVALPVNLGKLANISVTLGLIRPAVIAVGYVDDVPPPKAEVSQLDANVTANVLGDGTTSLLRIALKLQAATASAVPLSLNCNASQSSDQLATFRATTSALALGLQVGLFDDRAEVNAKDIPSTPLGGGTRTVAVTLGQFQNATPVPVPNPLTISGLVRDVGTFLNTVAADLRSNVKKCEGLAVLICPLLNLFNLVLSALLQLLSAIANSLAALLAALGVDAILQGLLDLLGIGLAQADLILDSYSCEPTLAR